MSTTLEALAVEVLRLPREDRSRRLDRLIDSLDVEEALDQAWDDEAARRSAEMASGQSIAVDGRAAVARLKAQVP